MDGERVKILIVDDQPRNLDALEVMLEPLGCTLVRAHSADEALLAMLREDFGALILDIRMPDMNGIELATLVKQRNRTRDVPILFLTAHVSEEEEVLEAYGVGGVDYLSKPIRADVLRSKVAVFAELHQKTRALVALNEELKHQVSERERAEITLQQINVDLEQRVAQRTEALARANQRARDNEERLRLAIDMAGIAPWELDVSTTTPEPGSGSARRWSWNMRMPLQRWTGALAELWGLDPGSVRTYADLHQRVHADDRGALEAHWAAALEEGRPFEMEYRIISGSGATRWIYSKGEPVYNEAGEPARLIGNHIDITERKRTDEALRAADRNKSEFIAMLAHELRNPLAPIRTAAEILSRTGGGSDPAQDQAVDVIGRQVRQMTRLVDDLLDVNRIAQGKITLQTTAVELGRLVSETAETCRPLFDDGEVQLTVAVPSAPVLVAADPARLAQIVHNLLSNAAKFTPRGGHVRLTVDAEAGSAIIRVVDDGIGIAHEQIDKVFDRFFQVDTSLERATGGLGLGLTLVKTLVELHQGTVHAHSAGKGLGTEFVVSVPLPAEPLAPLPPASPLVEERTEAGARRILIVDDNQDSAASLALLLEMAGHAIHVAHDGLDAVEMAARVQPDLVLLDLGLPRLNGYDAARRIRALPSGRSMVIVAVTGWGQDSDRQKTVDAGFDVHLVKPVDPDALMKLIAAHPSALRRSQPVATRTAAPES
jgi:PAS domain S-box-containing protein